MPGDPSGKAWTEFGNLDTTGHNEGIGMARRIPELLSTLVQRVESLLEAGWKVVRVVTDHGWLLMPKGLPKTDLPKFLTATRWRRCAVVKPNADDLEWIKKRATLAGMTYHYQELLHCGSDNAPAILGASSRTARKWFVGRTMMPIFRPVGFCWYFNF